jgi:hypothetical protein
LPQRIAQEFVEANFESGMGLIHDELGMAIPELMRQMAIYFVQFRPVGRNTLYCRLVRDLQAAGLLNRTLFSTLNYECVLDFSLVEHGHRIDYFANDDAGAVPLWKLHGSCNMFSEGLQATPGVFYGTGVTFEGGIQALADPNRVIQHCLVETALAPVMSLYMRGKPLAVSPSAIAQLQQRWSNAVSAATVVIVVGVRPWPADDHIWQPLAKTAAHLLYVGDPAVFSDWVASARAGPYTLLAGRFSRGFSTILPLIATLCS